MLANLVLFIGAGIAAIVAAVLKRTGLALIMVVTMAVILVLKPVLDTTDRILDAVLGPEVSIPETPRVSCVPYSMHDPEQYMIVVHTPADMYNSVAAVGSFGIGMPHFPEPHVNGVTTIIFTKRIRAHNKGDTLWITDRDPR